MEGWRDGGMEGGMDGRMDGWTDGRMDGWTDGWMDGWMEGRIGPWTEGRSDHGRLVRESMYVREVFELTTKRTHLPEQTRHHELGKCSLARLHVRVSLGPPSPRNNVRWIKSKSCACSSESVAQGRRREQNYQGRNEPISEATHELRETRDEEQTNKRRNKPATNDGRNDVVTVARIAVPRSCCANKLTTIFGHTCAQTESVQ